MEKVKHNIMWQILKITQKTDFWLDKKAFKDSLNDILKNDLHISRMTI